MRSPAGIVLTALVMTVAGLGTVVSQPLQASSAAAAPSSFALEGVGWGHGVGMSQYGAQTAASRDSMTQREILAFYYPGTKVGAASGNILVKITAATSASLVVGHRSALQFRSTSSGKSWALTRSGARRWRITELSGNRSRLSVLTDKWRAVKDIAGQAEFTAGGSAMRLYLPGGSSVNYRGRLRSAEPASGGARQTVNVIRLDSYLRGVVPREMPALWHKEALRAQAVAARTYAAHERATTNRGHFDVYDTTQSQVYGGATSEQPQSDAAVAATAGEIRTYDGTPAFTQFSSSNGGWTVAGSAPYLTAVADPHDPVRTWTATVSAASIQKAWPAVGVVQSVQVLTRDGNGLWGGRVTQVRILGSLGPKTVAGTTFRSVLGLKSTLFRLT